MGWFQNQIEERRQSDNLKLEESLLDAAGVIMGRRSVQKVNDERFVTKSAIDEILKYYHFQPVEVPEQIKDKEEQMDYCLRPHGLMRRTVELPEKWYKDAWGPMIGFLGEDKMPVALIPGRIRGYSYKDPQTGEKCSVNRITAGNLDREAVCFYRPLPQKKLGIPDLLLYLRHCIRASDMIMLIAVSYAVILASLVMPWITKMLTGPVLNSRQSGALIGIAVFMTCAALSTQLLNSTKGLLESRVSITTGISVDAAMMIREMSLPASFFRDYSPGELKSRSASVNQLCSLLTSIVLTGGLTSFTSLLYLGQIFQFTSALAVPALIVVLVTVGFSVITVLMQTGINRKMMDRSAKETGRSYSLISGVQKIKLAGAEKRAFTGWMKLYTQVAELRYNPPLLIKINSVISTAIGLVSNIILYYLAIKAGVDQSSFFAFSSSFGMLMGAFSSLTGIALSAAQIKPILEMAEPFLEAEPELADHKEIVTGISGSVSMENVSFRYSEETPYVLENLSLKIKSGEYVAVVGKTGCGKSTLIRLLLGFEKPEKGAVYYDNRNINSLDLPSLRKKIGTVMQDSGLFQGDIYSNIVISAPSLPVEAAWEAAETAGIADDIRALPMGMSTFITEGQGGISGGQKQRIMIARAIAPKPKLLLFDEATSALDNKTQRQVSEALDSMGCTRVIIAHRLSTIRHCDRILVLDGGKIIEEGDYETLIDKGGFFADLVERQRLDTA